MLDRAAAEWRRFLSTPSVRRATFQNWSDRAIRDISIHALREEGDHVCFEFALGDFISIHALREEGDVDADLTTSLSSNFYPRPP